MIGPFIDTVPKIVSFRRRSQERQVVTERLHLENWKCCWDSLWVKCLFFDTVSPIKWVETNPNFKPVRPRSQIRRFTNVICRSGNNYWIEVYLNSKDSKTHSILTTLLSYFIYKSPIQIQITYDLFIHRGKRHLFTIKDSRLNLHLCWVNNREIWPINTRSRHITLD